MTSQRENVMTTRVRAKIKMITMVMKIGSAIFTRTAVKSWEIVKTEFL